MNGEDDVVNDIETLNRARETLRREAEELAKLDEVIKNAEAKEKEIHRTEEL